LYVEFLYFFDFNLSLTLSFLILLEFSLEKDKK